LMGCDSHGSRRGVSPQPWISVFLRDDESSRGARLLMLPRSWLRGGGVCAGRQWWECVWVVGGVRLWLGALRASAAMREEVVQLRVFLACPPLAAAPGPSAMGRSGPSWVRGCVRVRAGSAPCWGRWSLMSQPGLAPPRRVVRKGPENQTCQSSDPRRLRF
jgi:hypothetical protein